MASHTIKFQIWYNDQWNDVPTYNRQEVTITRGRQDQLSRVSPSRLSGVQINNRDGKYSPRNAGSELYGLIGRNTRCRLLVDGDVRFVGEVEAWPVRWTRGGTDVWVPIVANGIMHRLGMPGQKATARSAIRRFCDPVIAARVGRLAPRSYWPIDHGEPSAADQAAALVGGMPLVLDYAVGEATASWSAAELAPWLGSGLQIDGALSLSGKAPAGAAVTEAVAADVLLRNGLPRGTTGALSLRLFDAATAGGDTYLYQLIGTLSSFSTGLFLYRQTGSAVDPFGAGTDAHADALWNDRLRHLRVMAVQNGSDVDVSAYIDGELVASGTHSSATLGVPSWQLVMTGTPQAVLGHAMLWAGDAADVPSAADVWEAAQGYPGEQAHDRIDRVFDDEDGITVTVSGSQSAKLGPQPIEPAMTIGFESADADHGFLFEPRDSFGLAYRCLSDLYNQSPAVTLTYGQKELGGDPQPSEDLDLVQNDVTVKRSGGAEARAVQETGPLNVQEPVDDPQGVGRISVDYTLNLETDTQTGHHAGWLRRLGTTPDPRYPTITVDIDALTAQGKTSLVTSAVAVDIGDRVVIDSPPDFAGTDSSVDQIVHGSTERVSLTRRRIEWNCTPYEPWRVQQLADGPLDVEDLDGRLVGDLEAAIRAAITKTDTSIVFDPNFYRWATLWLHETFSDPEETGEWGTPDVGPDWVTYDDAGGTPSVSGGQGLHEMDATDSTVRMRVGALELRDVEVWVLGIGPDQTPTGGTTLDARVDMRETGDYSSWVDAMVTFLDDGTAEVRTAGVEGSTLSETIPDVSGSEEVDLRAQLVGQTLRIWAAPSSTGIDLESAPLLTRTITPTAAGHVLITTDTDATLSPNPLTMRYSRVWVGSPGTLPGDFPMDVRLVSSPSAPTSGGEVVEASQITTTEAAYVAAGTADHDDNAAVTPADYTGGAADDWVVVIAAVRDADVTLSISDANYTFTEIGQQGGLYVWATVRTSDTPAPTVTPSGGASGDTVSAVMVGLENMPLTLDLDEYVLDSAGQTNTSAQNIAYPGLVAGIYWGRVVLLVVRKSDDWTGVAAPSGFTEAVDVSTTSGDDQGLAVYYRIDSAPKKVDPGALTVTGGASAVSDALVLALAGGYQAMTVTRSGNGVEKAHATGTRLEVVNPIVSAL